MIKVISKGLLKRPLALGRWRPFFAFGGRGLAEMPGRWWFEVFVSGWLFWFYFSLREVKKRDMAPALPLDAHAVAPIPVNGVVVDAGG